MKYTIKIFSLIALNAIFIASILAQENAETIFNKAKEQMLSENVELTLEMNTTDNKGKTKEKGFSVLIAKFGDIDKTKVIWQKPERAKGTTIVISTPPDDIGLIEVFTPSNGKIRKMKATEKNMELMGSDFSITNMRISNSIDLNYNLLGKEKLHNKSCYKIEVKEKNAVDGSKGELLIEEKTYRIVQVTVYDHLGNKSSISKLSDYQKIHGIENKFQAMNIKTEDFENKKHTEIKVLNISYMPNLTDEDFKLPDEIVK